MAVTDASQTADRPDTAHVADVLCVYYKVDAGQHPAVASRVQQLQIAVKAQWPGLTAELLQRPEVTVGVETWMETYRHADGLSAAFIDAIALAAVNADLPAPRHTERFVVLL